MTPQRLNSLDFERAILHTTRIRIILTTGGLANLGNSCLLNQQPFVMHNIYYQKVVYIVLKVHFISTVTDFLPHVEAIDGSTFM